MWDNASSDAKKKLDAIHIEAGRIISGTTKLCSIEKLLVELGWDTLKSRRDKHKLIIFYKITHGLSPNYLRDLVPPLVQDTSNYNLPNANNIQTFASNTNLFYNSFFPSSVRAWNALPVETKQATTVSAFKNKLNTNLMRSPKYYNTGTRLGQILHARLRMECSSLNSHLYHKNIIESPSCACGVGGGSGSAHHFYLPAQDSKQLEMLTYLETSITILHVTCCSGLKASLISKTKPYSCESKTT